MIYKVIKNRLLAEAAKAKAKKKAKKKGDTKRKPAWIKYHRDGLGEVYYGTVATGSNGRKRIVGAAEQVKKHLINAGYSAERAGKLVGEASQGKTEKDKQKEAAIDHRLSVIDGYLNFCDDGINHPHSSKTAIARFTQAKEKFEHLAGQMKGTWKQKEESKKMDKKKKALKEDKMFAPKEPEHMKVDYFAKISTPHTSFEDKTKNEEGLLEEDTVATPEHTQPDYFAKFLDPMDIYRVRSSNIINEDYIGSVIEELATVFNGDEIQDILLGIYEDTNFRLHKWAKMGQLRTQRLENAKTYIGGNENILNELFGSLKVKAGTALSSMGSKLVQSGLRGKARETDRSQARSNFASAVSRGAKNTVQGVKEIGTAPRDFAKEYGPKVSTGVSKRVSGIKAGFKAAGAAFGSSYRKSLGEGLLSRLFSRNKGATSDFSPTPKAHPNDVAPVTHAPRKTRLSSQTPDLNPPPRRTKQDIVRAGLANRARTSRITTDVNSSYEQEVYNDLIQDGFSETDALTIASNASKIKNLR